MSLTTDRLARNRSDLAKVAAAGLVASAAAVTFAVTAAAEPPPPAPVLPGPPPAAAPAPPPPPAGPTMPVLGAPLGPAGFSVLAQSGSEPVPGAFGAPPVVGLDKTTVLGQLPVPAAPGAGTGAPPNLNPFNNAYGVGQCLVPSAPGECEQFDVAPGQENADVSRREWFGRFIDMHRAGMLKGGLLGQLPQQQLGEPLPGTAPPPGTNIPPGLAQYLPPPPDDAPPPAPAPVLPPPG